MWVHRGHGDRTRPDNTSISLENGRAHINYVIPAAYLLNASLDGVRTRSLGFTFTIWQASA
eukprot:scaffold604_cov384-Prasinococcus_capsulatus_cf.AAC.31